MSVVALITDFIFATKVRSTGESLGVPTRIVRRTADLVAAAGEASLAIIDMNASGDDPVEAIRQLRALSRPPRVVAFLSHVQQELASAAREAGADEVMPRSRFSNELPSILQGAGRES